MRAPRLAMVGLSGGGRGTEPAPRSNAPHTLVVDSGWVTAPRLPGDDQSSVHDTGYWAPRAANTWSRCQDRVDCSIWQA